MGRIFNFQQCKRFCMLDSIASDRGCFLPLFLDNDKLRWTSGDLDLSHRSIEYLHYFRPNQPNLYHILFLHNDFTRKEHHPCNTNDGTGKQPFKSIMLKYLCVVYKHRKNFECCPVSQLIVR